MTTTFDWSVVATGWETYRGDSQRQSSPVASTIRERLTLQPGDRVLELGCGTGELALALADAVGPGGSVLATDVASGMVEVARRTLSSVLNAQVAQADAADTGLEGASFDAVTMMMGLMFVPEPERAVAEIHRVLKPGGRAAFSVWAGPDKNLWLSSIGMAAMMHGVVAGGPPTGPGGLFSLADADRFTEVVASAGFAEAEVIEVPFTMHWPDADAYLDQVTALAGPLAVALAAAPEKLPDVRATATDLTKAFETPDGLVIPALARVAAVRR